MGNESANETIPQNMGAENTKGDKWPNKNSNGWRNRTNDELQLMWRK
jgi:hypothetical protein